MLKAPYVIIVDKKPERYRALKLVMVMRRRGGSHSRTARIVGSTVLHLINTSPPINRTASIKDR